MQIIRRAALSARKADAPHTLIQTSGLFDPDWYRARLPEHERNTEDLIGHFLTEGTVRRLSPGPLFDTQRYFDRYWNLEPGTLNGLLHYLRCGIAENQQVDGVCDTRLRDDTGPVAPTELRPLRPDAPKAAVTIHAPRPEILDAIFDRLRHFPETFTLLITTDTTEKRHEIEARIARAELKAAPVLVRVARRHGSHFGPFLTTFATPLRGHELMLHLHTDTNPETLARLLPSRSDAIAAILNRFREEPRLGLLQTTPSARTPWWRCTWLGNHHLARPLLARMNISAPSGYFSHPPEGQFWARTHAIAPLLNTPWSEADFPAEDTPREIPENGNIADAITRILEPVIRSQDCHTDEYDPEAGLIRIGHSRMDLDQYERRSEDDLRTAIRQAGTVSFDLFDTLLTRIALTPDTIHYYVAARLARRFPDLTPAPAAFVALRKQAEHNAREALAWTDDVGLDDIYSALAALTAWNENILTIARQLEVETDRAVLRPRPEIIDALRYAREQGRRTLLISDTFLSRDDIAPVLERTGILPLIDEIYLSSERLARKDRGDMWDLVQAAEDSSGLLHIGDNEHADIQRADDLGIRHFHVMSGLNMLRLNPIGPDVAAVVTPASLPPDQPLEERRLAGDILLGPLVSDLFASPFACTPDRRLTVPRTLTTPEEVGRTLFGPLLLSFMAQLITHPATERTEKLLFVSREGYFLSRLYRDLRETYALQIPDAMHFHCSRRVAISAAQTIRFDPDILTTSGDGFRGTMASLLTARLGVQIPPDSPLHHLTVVLPEDRDTVRNLTLLLRDDILAQARISHDALTAYARACGLTPETHPGYGIVDVGYSATIQRHLQTTFNLPLTGFYMAAETACAAVENSGGTAFGLFATGPDAEAFRRRHGLFIESVLTAPHGQTIGYTRETSLPQPIFAPDTRPRQELTLVEDIFAGASAWCHDLIRSWGPDVLHTLRTSAPAGTALLTAFTENRINISPDILKTLAVEDEFCGRGHVRFA
ncbi:rhamnan synthesis F family protein [Acetobacter oeni]|uniref:Uncharacterized protein n=1 Tax=Acetobacter oeni TaxID=304077 RepID=A0A511XH22_9PROT|nr:rhamnan synthesis F family protein [Acetobacter oeni]MBB3882388.1 FMN phosphatase YigB (HAD superfamily) [Acetobacter oeni]NHO18511.1 hypothetical protein [Acetobacter oeni]GBR09368.1 hypothetical protein AA21952_2838 [Acetobacter oeni LMG 21952]GEN62247.1 hypothetical protein AOE01nite_04710 [Acetobacter oeni]